MFNMSDKSQKKIFKTVCDRAGLIAVHCKMIVGTRIGVNYLINIEDYAGRITVLLDKDGNPMLSQVKL
ncbi:DUF6440 family protein [Clostridium sp.]|jgi:hypothetical protein|uniref:DUF6440 family protein n=1 Tax=Clostridium sp. TaxID=1506 RepID=UPI003EECA742